MKQRKKNFIIFCLSLGTIIVITLICSFTLIYLNNHPYKFEIKINMDNNTLEAVKSINWSSLENQEQSYPNCVYPAYCFTNYSDYINQFADKNQSTFQYKFNGK